MLLQVVCTGPLTCVLLQVFLCNTLNCTKKFDSFFCAVVRLGGGGGGGEMVRR